MTLKTPAKGCRVIVGWRWEVSAGGGKKELSQAPIGAMVLLEESLQLKQSRLPAGTILMQTTWGWTVVKREQAAKLARAYAETKGHLVQVDYSELGKLGLAVVERKPDPKRP